MKKLAVFFDGTWNTPSDRTNVYKLYKLVNDIDQDVQQAAYIQGVGTESGGLVASFKNFLSGAFGDGLSQNILQGYKWLGERFEPGDKIYIFGFSRGAYTARSLGGLIRNCGILRPDALGKIDAAYDIYRDHQPPDIASTVEFRARFANETPIEFIGVWDTVGALGIPVQGLDLPGFNQHYQFHDTHLSDAIKAGYHAIAIHEFREPYAPTLWTLKPGSTRPADRPVEQRWFIGAHSNVGGGYTGDKLCNPSCRWIQDMATKHGFEFLSPWPVSDADYQCPPRDSYAEFVKEHKAMEAVVKKVCRTVGAALNETIDVRTQAMLKNTSALLSSYSEDMRTKLINLATGL